MTLKLFNAEIFDLINLLIPPTIVIRASLDIRLSASLTFLLSDFLFFFLFTLLYLPCMSLYLPCVPFYLPFFCLPINHVCCLYTIFSVYPSCYIGVSIFTMFFCLFNMFIYLSTMFACLYTIFLSTHQVTILVFIFSIFSVYLPPLLVYL